MKNKIFKIHENDNVVVALLDLKKGEKINYSNATLLLKQDISFGHKICVNSISKGEKIIKYGHIIAIATSNIDIGMHVHTHNTKTMILERTEYKFCHSTNQFNDEISSKFFMGYKRNFGAVGIRNEIWIINTVGCINKVSKALENKIQKYIPNTIDGIYSIEHPYGCSQLGYDHKNTQKILKSLSENPNAGGVLILGLGCENNNISEFKKVLGDYDENRIKFLNSQDEIDEIESGLSLLKELINYVSKFKREKLPISELKIGLKCGGSDAFSGITANPLVGKLSDLIISHGGTSVLTEVPEMFGAEEILINRCKTKKTFDQMVDMINNFKDYFVRYNQPIYENPSPGNKDGGISTLEEKSLGCVQKGGQGSIVDVLNIGDVLSQKGLNILNGPGNDIVSTTLLSASGVNLILFTTGRGTPLGSIVPTIKISSNTPLFKRKRNWIDFDAGILLEDPNLEKRANELLDYIIAVAENRILTKNEINNYREIAIFKDGVTL